MEEASSRQTRLKALREKAAGVPSSASDPLPSSLPQPLLSNPFPTPPRAMAAGGAFNFYSNPLAAFNGVQPGVFTAPGNVLPLVHNGPPQLAPGTSWRPPAAAPFAGGQGLLPGPPPGGPPGWFQGQTNLHAPYGPGSNQHGGRGRGGAFQAGGVSAPYGRGRGGEGPAYHHHSNSQHRLDPRNAGGQDLSRGPKAARTDGGGRGRGGRGGRGGRDEGLSARSHPELFFHCSMVEDPWADLKREQAKRAGGRVGMDESWLPPSLEMGQNAVAAPEVKTAPGSSLADALAGALGAAHDSDAT